MFWLFRDPCLAKPGVDRLLAYPKLGGDLGHLPSALDQVHYAAPELRRIASSCDLVLLSPMATKSSFFPPSKRTTLARWLKRDDEPYKSFAIELRRVVNEHHRDPLWQNLLAASDAGDTRATIEALKVVDPATFRDPKKIDVTVRRGLDEDADLSRLTDEELMQLRAIQMKLLAEGGDNG